jgi:nucleotide-binding universal stress UspA family protein
MFKILALTDFSQNAHDALCIAMRLAQRYGGEVIFAHAMTDPPVPATAPQSLFSELLAADRTKYTEQLRQEVQQLFKELDIRHKEVIYKTQVVSLPFAEEMVRLSEEHNVDLVVIGSTGATGLKRVVIGNSTLQLEKRSSKPLLMIPRGYSFNGFHHIALIIRPHRFEYKGGIDVLLRIARSFSATLDFIFVTDAEKESPAAADFLKKHNLLQAVQDFSFTSHTISGLDKTKALKAHFQRNETDLLAAFPSSKSIWEELFSESLTEEMAHQRDRPLLVYPKPNKD